MGSNRSKHALQAACRFEPLESRVLMSADPAPRAMLPAKVANPAAIHAAAPKAVAPAAPSHLTAVTLAFNSVRLSWKPGRGATDGFAIFRGTDGIHFTQIGTAIGAATLTFTDNAATSFHANYYKVEAYKSTAFSKPSAAASAITPLAAVTVVSGAATGSNSIQLTWTINEPSASGYYVLRSTDGKNFTQFAQLPGIKTGTYTDNSVVSNNTYSYEVQAYNGSNKSAPSAIVTVNTPLAAPSGLGATVLSPTSVSLAWTDNDVNAAGYDVLRSNDGVHFTQIASLAGVTIATYTDAAADSGQSYSYEVQAFAGATLSSASIPASVTTPLAAPTGLNAVATGPTTVQLGWTNSDPLATGYNILRSTNGGTFTQVTQIASATTLNWVDDTVSSDNTYAYEVQATGPGDQSAVAAGASVTTPLIAVSALTATVQNGAATLTWTDNDLTAGGYFILRSINGGAYATLATLNTGTAAGFSDSTVLTGQVYGYEVQAFNGANESVPSTPATITTPLTAPSLLTAVSATSGVQLSWNDNDTNATGYQLLRSTDGITFTQLTQITGGSINTYVDTTVAAGHTYLYQVQAVNGVTTSSVSTAATVTTPTGYTTGGVSVTTRFGDELVITSAGTIDSISITESNGTLTIVGDGQTFTDAAPAGGTFIYTRGGADSIAIGGSVTSPLTVDSIDGTATTINSSGTSVNAWIDSTDTLIGTATVHAVAGFAGGVTKALGASLANPTDAATTAVRNLSLFGTGPIAADVNQGETGDCYFLSSLAAFANEKPQVLLNSAVDLGDGTYAVEFHGAGSQTTYVRVSNSFTTGGFGGYYYAHPGKNNTIWAAIMEKAFAYFRTGANTYASLNNGSMDTVYRDLGVQSTDLSPSSLTDSALYTLLSTDLANGEAVTIATGSAPNLVSDHAYTLMSVSNVNGVNYYTVRNPWGSSGDSLENSQGIATLTYAQFIANFLAGTMATN